MSKRKIVIWLFLFILVFNAVPAIANIDEQEFIEMFGSVKETVQPRDIDKQAAQLSKEYAAAKNIPSPTRGRDGSVQYVFSTTIPRILCRPLRVTDIALEPGEKITNAPFVGDSVNWTILPSLSGTGNNTTYHIMIKPTMPDIVTNLVVHTDRRTYHFDLVSSKEMYTPYVSFVYPQEVNTTWANFFEQVQRNVPAQEVPVLPTKRGQDLKSTLNYNYKIAAKNKNISWVPLSVYDDGIKTYIEFPDILSSVEAPVFFITMAGKKEMVNYRKYGTTYIVDRLFDSGVLIAGTGKVAKTVTITKTTKTTKTIKDTTSAPTVPMQNLGVTGLWDVLRADVAKNDAERGAFNTVPVTKEVVSNGLSVNESQDNEEPDAGNVYTDYKITSQSRVPWEPLSVFDDGIKTYMRMPEHLLATPALYIFSNNGNKEALINYRVNGRYYIVDCLFDKAHLRIGGRRVIITRGQPAAETSPNTTREESYKQEK